MRRQDPPPTPPTAPHPVAKSIEDRSSSPPQQDIPRSLDNDDEKKEVIDSNAEEKEGLGLVKEVVSTSEEEKRVASTMEEVNIVAAKVVSEDKDSEVEDEEQGECGFCLFMKGGGCKDNFIAWEKCVEEAEKNKEDIVEKCFEVTGLLKKCMDAHADYYEPILRAEKAMEEEAEKELEKDSKANAEIVEGEKDAGQNAPSSPSFVIEKK